MNVAPPMTSSPPRSSAHQDRVQLIEYLRERAKFLRVKGLFTNNRTLHSGACLSSADIIASLFYYFLKLDPRKRNSPDRDVFINSRGHACEPIYVGLADLGYFPEEDLDHVEEGGCHLHGLTATTTPGIEFSCGSLGQGLSLAVGMALGKQAQGHAGKVCIVTGDGECQEGNLWEAAMAASHYKLDRLTVIVDRNGYQSNDRGTENIMSLEPLDERFAAFGFSVQRVDGHDMEKLVQALDRLPFAPGKPSAIIADTGKGHGVSLFENGNLQFGHCGRFGRDFPPALFPQALEELALA